MTLLSRRPPADLAPVASGQVVFFVRDNGLGIAPAYQTRIFQVFQRAHLGVAPGEGMGLAIVQKIIELHGGRVFIEPACQQGTAFIFSLPKQPELRRGDAPHDAAPKGTHGRIYGPVYQRS